MINIATTTHSESPQLYSLGLQVGEAIDLSFTKGKKIRASSPKAAIFRLRKNKVTPLNVDKARAYNSTQPISANSTIKE